MKEKKSKLIQVPTLLAPKHSSSPLKKQQQKKKKQQQHKTSTSTSNSRKNTKKRVELKNIEDDVINITLDGTTQIIRRTSTITTTITTTTLPVPGSQAGNPDEDAKSGKKISIYFSVSGRKRMDPLKWYKIDPDEVTDDDDDADPQLLTSFSTMPNTIKFTAVGLDSKIYAMGASVTSDGWKTSMASSKVLVFDTTTPTPEWNQCSSMNSPRVKPAAAAVDGLIYALGSYYDSLNCQPCAEFFNPSKNLWTPLLPPSYANHLPNVMHSTFSQERQEIIIFSFSDYLHCFNVKDHSWKRIPIPVENIVTHHTRSVAVGHVIYTFYKGKLYACDLSKPTPSVEIVHGLEEETASIDPECFGMTIYLFYIGNGKMCLVWDGVPEDSDNLISIQCLKFWVGTPDGGKRLHAVIDRSEYYLAEGEEIKACCAM